MLNRNRRLTMPVLLHLQNSQSETKWWDESNKNDAGEPCNQKLSLPSESLMRRARSLLAACEMSEITRWTAILARVLHIPRECLSRPDGREHFVEAAKLCLCSISEVATSVTS